ncbi:hypothetical protein RD792_003094, partial [Penstemon davidsonii]
MGYLLKEALKTLCGVNQWSYAVFWKFGCQNPKLLIWEDSYSEPASCSETAFQDYNATWISTETRNSQTGDKVHLLVNKMMMDNQVNIVGEGLVGRVAFTGNYQWILSDNYFRETRPPEVLREICQQFSAGMQTVAVIPVLPHGVVQFGSFKTIMENTGFVNDVISLVLQLGYVPGALLSENYTAKELAPKIGDPICHENSTPQDFCSSLFDSLNYGGSSSQYSVFEQEFQNDLQSNVAEYQASNSMPSHVKMDSAIKLDFSPQNQLINGVAKAEVIPSNSQIWMNQQASLYTPRSNLDLSALRTNSGLMNPTSGANSVSDAKRAAFTFKNPTSSELKNVNLSKMEVDSNSDSADLLVRNSLPAYSSGCKTHHMDKKFAQSELSACKEDTQHRALNISKYDDDYVESQTGDDLFDILGADFKKKIFNNGSESALNARTLDKDNFSSKNSWASSEIYTTSQGNSDSGNFSLIDTDHLLDAVVSKVQPSVNENVTCKTTVTNTSSSCATNTSLPYGRFGVSDHMKGELFGVTKYLTKAGAMSSSSIKTGSSKEDSRTYSQDSSIYGSQVSSWIENGQKTKQNKSVSTGYSKKPDEGGKTNRKRLKPGENPRPRPKDRQMIQDRVKELREIVPNGAKVCSIDALLERTIKHMLFLQSVTKHADKLKQTGESKLISKDGGLLLKDNFEGGATWAYEVGSQSMVCPIIVEDLNQPRQMLVEMLCEERGLFLEIADIIRGLGLTILKGVMETRSNKIWARFVVEANRDVTRMEIFISLVRLLEQTAKTGASQPNNITSENMMVPLTG